MGEWQTKQQMTKAIPVYTQAFNRPSIFKSADIGETEETEIDYLTELTPELSTSLMTSIATSLTPFQLLDRKHLIVLSQIEMELRKEPTWKEEWHEVIKEKRTRWIGQLLTTKTVKGQPPPHRYKT